VQAVLARRSVPPGRHAVRAVQRAARERDAVALSHRLRRLTDAALAPEVERQPRRLSCGRRLGDDDVLHLEAAAARVEQEAAAQFEPRDGHGLGDARVPGDEPGAEHDVRADVRHQIDREAVDHHGQGVGARAHEHDVTVGGGGDRVGDLDELTGAGPIDDVHVRRSGGGEGEESDEGQCEQFHGVESGFGPYERERLDRGRSP